MSNQEGSDKKQKSFWETAPGILAAIAALVTAIGGCVAIIAANPRLLDLVFPASPTPTLVERIESPPPISVTLTDTASDTSTIMPTFTQVATLTPTEPPPPTFTPTEPPPPTFTPPPARSVQALTFMPEESGWITQSGSIGTGSDHPPQAGDFNNNEAVRGFLSFDLATIPSNATIQSAKLILPMSAQGNGDVFPNFGSLAFEAVWYGLSLNPGAFDSPAYIVLQNAYGPRSEIGVAAGVEQAIQQGYRRFQIRFSFSLGTDGDNSGENYWMPDAPSLEVVYTIP